MLRAIAKTTLTGTALVLKDLIGADEHDLAPPLFASGRLHVALPHVRLGMLTGVAKREAYVLPGREVRGVSTPLLPLLARRAPGRQDYDGTKHQHAHDLLPHDAPPSVNHLRTKWCNERTGQA